MAVTYAKARGLEAGASSPAQLLLDPDLSDALFKACSTPTRRCANPLRILS